MSGDLAQVAVRESYSEGYADVDVGLMQRMLANLLVNAAQAMDGRGEIHCVVNVEDNSHGKRVLVCIEDTGPGVAEDMREKIFQPFVTTKTQGTGLGLAICRKIAVDHQGDLTIQSNGRKGSRFTVALPQSTEVCA